MLPGHLNFNLDWVWLGQGGLQASRWVCLCSLCLHFGIWAEELAVIWGMIFSWYFTEAQETKPNYAGTIKSSACTTSF